MSTLAFVALPRIHSALLAEWRLRLDALEQRSTSRSRAADPMALYNTSPLRAARAAAEEDDVDDDEVDQEAEAGEGEGGDGVGAWDEAAEEAQTGPTATTSSTVAGDSDTTWAYQTDHVHVFRGHTEGHPKGAYPGATVQVHRDVALLPLTVRRQWALLQKVIDHWVGQLLPPVTETTSVEGSERTTLTAERAFAALCHSAARSFTSHDDAVSASSSKSLAVLLSAAQLPPQVAEGCRVILDDINKLRDEPSCGVVSGDVFCRMERACIGALASFLRSWCGSGGYDAEARQREAVMDDYKGRGEAVTAALEAEVQRLLSSKHALRPEIDEGLLLLSMLQGHVAACTAALMDGGVDGALVSHPFVWSTVSGGAGDRRPEGADRLCCAIASVSRTAALHQTLTSGTVGLIAMRSRLVAWLLATARTEEEEHVLQAGGTLHAVLPRIHPVNVHDAEDDAYADSHHGDEVTPGPRTDPAPRSLLSDSAIAQPVSCISLTDRDSTHATHHAIDVEAATRLFPLRHLEQASRPNPFRVCGRSGVALLSHGSDCLLVGPVSQLRACDVTSFPAPLSQFASVPPSTSFTTNLYAASAHRRPQTTYQSSTATEGDGMSGMSPCAYAPAALSVVPCGDAVDASAGWLAACGVNRADGRGGVLQLLRMHRDTTPAIDSSLRAFPTWPAASGSGDVRLVPEVIPSVRHTTHRLRLASWIGEARDPAGLGIRQTVALTLGVVVVGPVLRLVNTGALYAESERRMAAELERQDALDAEGQKGHGASRGRWWPVAASPDAETYFHLLRCRRLGDDAQGDVDADDAQPVTASVVSSCGYGASGLATSCGSDDATLWDLWAGAAVATVRDANGSSNSSDPQTVFTTALTCSNMDHCVAIGSSNGMVALWDCRCRRIQRRFDTAPDSSCHPSYRMKCAVDRVRFGGLGSRTVFSISPSQDLATSAVRLFHVGYEAAPVWQSPPSAAVSAFDVGYGNDGYSTFLHGVTDDGSLFGSDVSHLVV